MFDKRSGCDVLVVGHFRVVHAGHVQLFKYSSQFGSVTVAINGQYWHENKYKEFALSVEHRREVLEAIRYIDRVIVFEEETPAQLIQLTKPNYYVKGPDYANKRLPEQWACDEAGTQVVFFNGSKTQLTSSSGLLASKQISL